MPQCAELHRGVSLVFHYGTKTARKPRGTRITAYATEQTADAIQPMADGRNASVSQVASDMLRLAVMPPPPWPNPNSPGYDPQRVAHLKTRRQQRRRIAARDLHQ